jgi:hypothetical protein
MINHPLNAICPYFTMRSFGNDCAVGVELGIELGDAI